MIHILFEMLVKNNSIRRVTKYFSASHILRLTRQFPNDKNLTRETMLVTQGMPNYREQAFIKKNGVPKRVQVEFYK